MDVPSCVVRELAPPDVEIYYGDAATPGNISLDAPVIYGVGHGECCVYTVQDLLPLFEVVGSCSDGYRCASASLPQLRGKKIHLLSCWAGARLGKALYEMGNEFLGYDSEVALAAFLDKYEPCVDTPTSNTTAFTRADYAGTQAMLSGASAPEAYDAAYEAYEEEIKKYEASSDPIAPAVVRLLKANQLSLVSYPGPSPVYAAAPAAGPQPGLLAALAAAGAVAGLVAASLAT